MEAGTNPFDLIEKLVDPNARRVLEQKYNDSQGQISISKIWSTLQMLLLTQHSNPIRPKSDKCQDIFDFVKLLKKSKNIIIVTGAGISVSCGIPDFRSKTGVYAKLKLDYPDLPNPQAMFDIDFFKTDPRPFFDFAQQLWPGNFKPSATHNFISKLDREEKLLRNYTQNIDTLEQVSGIKNVVQCHGSFASATCKMCGKKYKAEDIKEKVFNKEIPYCDCSENRFQALNRKDYENDPFVINYLNELKTAHNLSDITQIPDSIKNQIIDKLLRSKLEPIPVIKPDIVFFGEPLSDAFHNQITEDKDKADLVIVIGSSMKVRPVCLIPTAVEDNIPQVLINREPLEYPMNFDLELLGNCDLIIEFIEELMSIPSGDTEEGRNLTIEQKLENLTFTETDDLDVILQEENVKKYFCTAMDEDTDNHRYLFKGCDPELVEEYKEILKEYEEDLKEGESGATKQEEAQEKEKETPEVSKDSFENSTEASPSSTSKSSGKFSARAIRERREAAEKEAAEKEA